MQALIKMPDSNKLTLEQFHTDRSAKMIDFSGWRMPLSYGSSVSEHMAVRENAGFFDVSHMGEFMISGTESIEFLNLVLTIDLNRVIDGQAKYSLICNNEGGVLDDLIIYRISRDAFLMCVNAANTESVLSYLQKISSDFECSIEDLSGNYGLLAVQGPRTLEVLQNLLSKDLASIKRMHFQEMKFFDTNFFVARTGYTGEDGFEFFVPIECLSLFAELLDQTCKVEKTKWVGLAARDSLRLEAGYPLHGHELSAEITPLEAGLMWAVSLKKENFIGKEAIIRKIELNSFDKVMYYKALDRRIPREGDKIFYENELAGSVLSGGYSPQISSPIGTALVKNQFAEKKDFATSWFADVRGNREPIEFGLPILKEIKKT